MNILLTRPEQETAPLVRQLSKAGHQVVVSPVIAIRPIPARTINPRPFKACAATSANAVRAAASLKLGHLPLHVVGQATADAASAAGFQDVRPAGGTAGDLAEAIPPDHSPLLYLTGTPRKPDLERRLAGRRIKVTVQELYRSDPIAAMTPAAQKAMADGTLDLVLLYSARSAKAFLAQIRSAGLEDRLKTITAGCLSPAVAAEAGASFRDVVVADRPDEQGLLSALADRLGLAQGQKEDSAVADQKPPETDRQDAEDRADADPDSPSANADQLAQEPPSDPKVEIPPQTDAASDQPGEPTDQTKPQGQGEPEPDPQRKADPAPDDDIEVVEAEIVDDDPKPNRRFTLGPGWLAAAVLAVFALGLLIGPMLRPSAPSDGREPAYADDIIDIASDIQTLQSRMAGIEEAIQQLVDRPPPDPQALSDQVAADLANRVKALEDRPTDENGAVNPVVAERLAALENQLTDLADSIPDKAAVETLISDAAPARARLREQLDKLSNRLTQLELREAAVTTGPNLAYETAGLARKVATGNPFAADVEAVRALLSDDPVRRGASSGALATLERFGATGVPTLQALTRDFDRLAGDVLQADATALDDGASLWQRLKAQAAGIVTVRPQSPVDDDNSLGADLTRIAQALEDSDLAGALALADRLGDTPREVLRGWRGRARDRLEADRALETLFDIARAGQAGN